MIKQISSSIRYDDCTSYRMVILDLGEGNQNGRYIGGVDPIDNISTILNRNKMEMTTGTANMAVESRFQDILGRFREELNVMDDSSAVIQDKLNILWSFKKEPSLVEADKQPLEPGVVNELNMYLGLFNVYNQRLKEVKNTLIELVG